jgi:uncharacterized membrane protein
MKQIFKKIKYTVLTLALLSGLSLLFFTPVTASAQSLFSGAKKEACAGTQLTGDATNADCSAGSETDLTNTIQKGIDLISIVVGVIAVLMIIIGGIRFVVSNGDSNKVTTARNTIVYALIGLILVALAQVIVKFVLSNV